MRYKFNIQVIIEAGDEELAADKAAAYLDKLPPQPDISVIGYEAGEEEPEDSDD